MKYISPKIHLTITALSYLEAVGVLYGTPTYCFSHIAHLLIFLRAIPKPHVLRLRNIELIQHVSPFLYGRNEFHSRVLPWADNATILQQRIKWEQGFCELVSYRMPQVSLKVALFPDPVSAPLADEPLLLAPLMNMPDTRKIQIELPGADSWDRKGKGDRPRLDNPAEPGAKKYPFTISRRPPVREITNWVMRGAGGTGLTGPTANPSDHNPAELYFSSRHTRDW
jgi:hypothetical protein